jgi:hypothetical protein
MRDEFCCGACAGHHAQQRLFTHATLSVTPPYICSYVAMCDPNVVVLGACTHTQLLNIFSGVITGLHGVIIYPTFHTGV